MSGNDINNPIKSLGVPTGLGNSGATPQSMPINVGQSAQTQAHSGLQGHFQFSEIAQAQLAQAHARAQAQAQAQAAHMQFQAQLQAQAQAQALSQKQSSGANASTVGVRDK